MGSVVGVPALVSDTTDWFSNSLPTSRAHSFPNSKFTHFLQVWRVFSQGNSSPVCQEICPNSLETFSVSESYIILHVENDTEPTKSLFKSQDFCAPDSVKAIPSFATLNPEDLKLPLVSKMDHQFIMKSATRKCNQFEIFVWNGKESSPLIWSSAIAKAHRLDSILVGRISIFGTLDTIVSSWTGLNHILRKPLSDKKLRGLQRENKFLYNLLSSLPITLRDTRHGSLPAGHLQRTALKKNNSAPMDREQFKLNLPSVLFIPNTDSTEGLHERDRRKLKLNQASKQCSLIIQNLYLSGELVASNQDQLQDNGIQYILNCAGGLCKNYFPNVFTYRVLYLQDAVHEDISCLFLDILNWMDQILSKGEKLLVHCHQGVSRSSSMIIMYLMWKNSQPFNATHEFVKTKRSVANPNTGFQCALLNWGSRLTAIRNNQLENNPWLVWISRHCKQDPDQWVMRDIKECNTASLDSRGVFLVFTSQVFMWIGRESSSKAKRAARRYVKLAHKYLQTPSNVIQVLEGEEDESFFNLVPKATTRQILKDLYDAELF